VAINRPDLKNTLSHRFATDTAISFMPKNPSLLPPPSNVPTFPGQLVAVRISADECQLYVAAEDRTRWLKVVS